MKKDDDKGLKNIKKSKLFLIIVSVAIVAVMISILHKTALPLAALPKNTFTPTETAVSETTNISKVDKLSNMIQSERAGKAEQNHKSQDIIECGPVNLDDSEQYEALIKAHLSSLNKAVLYEQKLIYALFGNYQTMASEDERLSLLFEFDTLYSKEPLVLMDALNLCAQSDHPKCTSDFVDYALSSDYQNAAMWLNAVMVHAAKGNDLAVLEIIAGLNKANVFNERYGERIAYFVDAMSSSEANKFDINLVSGIGIEAARSLSYAPITTWCKEGVKNSAKAAACLTLGQNMEKRAKVSINQAIGIAIQGIVYDAEQNDAALMELEKRRGLLYERDYEQINKAFDLFANDENRMKQWLQSIDSMGEYAAINMLVEDAIKVSQFIGEEYCGR